MKRFDGLNQAMVERFAPKTGRRELLPPLSEKAQVALMCRMLFREGWNEHIAGHITYRLADGNILTNPWELAWDELTASDIMTLDEKGKIIDGDWNITPAIGLHIQLHALRPELQVVIHNHAHWSGTWANLQRVPPVYDQTGAHCGVALPLYNGIPGHF
jgi:L-fuculose-phosphate aldolase